jgi:glycosyltransferase involved in cell wall biosynthesis
MRITYLYRSGRKSRLAEPGEGPTEFFYGYQQLRAKCLDVHILEDADIGMAPPLSPLPRLIGKLSAILGGLPVGMAAGLLMGRHCHRLKDAGCLVATTNGMGMALAMARACGRLKAPVLLLAMGLLPHRPSRLQLWLYRRLAKHISIACISRGEAEFLSKLFPGEDIPYIPFGVDHRFWLQTDGLGASDYALAIGNDLARDWGTLVAAWRPDFPTLKIVTNLTIPAHGSNIEVIRGDWRTQVFSDEEIRDLYRGARFVIVPLHDTIQPAGQSACLQAMACGRPVILSSIMGLWDRDLMQDGVNVLFVAPHDVAALTEAASRLLFDAKLCERIGRNARARVESDFNTDAMAAALRTVLEAASKS